MAATMMTGLTMTFISPAKCLAQAVSFCAMISAPPTSARATTALRPASPACQRLASAIHRATQLPRSTGFSQKEPSPGVFSQASGFTCPAHDAAKCLSCDSGFFLHEDECEGKACLPGGWCAAHQACDAPGQHVAAAGLCTLTRRMPF